MSAGHVPPTASRRPTVLRHGTDERVDDWHWLGDRDDPEVVEYLLAENSHTQSSLAHLAPLREQIYGEIKGRIRETDASAPMRWGQWRYFTRTVAGSEYRVHCRIPAGDTALPDPDAPPGSPPGEEIVLDENALADGSEFFALRGFTLSPDHTLLAYSSDLTGDERSTLRVRDLATGRDRPDEIAEVHYGLAWASDNRTIFYVRTDDALRPHQVWRHELDGGDGSADDELVFQEDDERFGVSVGRTRTGKYLLITSESKLTTEARFLATDDPHGSWQVVAPREQGVEYEIDHHHDPEHGDRWFVLTNADGATNFKLMSVAVGDGRDHWAEVIGHSDAVRLVDVDAFRSHLVVSERADGLERIRVVRISDGDQHTIAVPEEVYSVWVGGNPEFETTTVRYGYTSLTSPVSDFEYDLETRRSTLVKQQPVDGYDASRFETHRIWAEAPDGTRVPISIVHPRGVVMDGSAPLLMYGYGSYEITIDPTFSVSRLSLLERGVSFAIAHVRGGGELGRSWYDDGKLEHKRNTFTDFIACAEHLIAGGYTTPDHLVARGGSAGGLLMGAVTNLRPDLFHAVIAEVPFVDVLTTMLDESLPLTVTEWEEWGNPAASPAIYDYMKSYSPYDNVAPIDYPAILATGGLHDVRVQYWEPAKWVAKLRTASTSDAPIYLKIEMGAGHHGPSGRYESWREEAFVLSFILDQLGISE
jgi:oligopeptidase B